MKFEAKVQFSLNLEKISTFAENFQTKTEELCYHSKT